MPRKELDPAKATTKALAARLKTAIQVRCTYTHRSVEQVAEAIGKDTSALYNAMRGDSRFYFQDVFAIDGYFAALGAPGLIADLTAPATWTAADIPFEHAKLPPSASRMLRVVERIRAGGLGLYTVMAKEGVLDDVHVMAVSDTGITVAHCGDNMRGLVDPAIVNRDVRDLSDKDYVRFLYDSVPDLVRRGAPSLQRICSPTFEYTRLGIPTEDGRIVGFAFDHRLPGKNWRLS